MHTLIPDVLLQQGTDAHTYSEQHSKSADNDTDLTDAQLQQLLTKTVHCDW